MYIVVYRPHNALMCETKHFGPFRYYREADEFFLTVPVLGTFHEDHQVPTQGVRYIEYVDKPECPIFAIPRGAHGIGHKNRMYDLYDTRSVKYRCAAAFSGPVTVRGDLKDAQQIAMALWLDAKHLQCNAAVVTIKGRTGYFAPGLFQAIKDEVRAELKRHDNPTCPEDTWEGDSRFDAEVYRDHRKFCHKYWANIRLSLIEYPDHIRDCVLDQASTFVTCILHRRRQVRARLEVASAE